MIDPNVIRVVCFGTVWGAFLGSSGNGLNAWGLSPDLAVRRLVDRIILTRWIFDEN